MLTNDNPPDTTLDYAQAREEARITVELLADHIVSEHCLARDHIEIEPLLRGFQEATSLQAFQAIQRRGDDILAQINNRKRSTAR